MRATLVLSSVLVQLRPGSLFVNTARGSIVDEAALFKRLKEAGVIVLFTRIKAPIMNTLKRSGLRDEVGKEHFYRNPSMVFKRAWELVSKEEEEEQEQEESPG